MLPQRIPKPQKRASRWRSQAHERHVKSYACANCGSMENVEGAHVRLGSHTGAGQRPDDWRLVSLCVRCHRIGPQSQHDLGEATFWAIYKARTGQSVEALMAEFVRTSPKRAEIQRVQRERMP